MEAQYRYFLRLMLRVVDPLGQLLTATSAAVITFSSESLDKERWFWHDRFAAWISMFMEGSLSDALRLLEREQAMIIHRNDQFCEPHSLIASLLIKRETWDLFWDNQVGRDSSLQLTRIDRECLTALACGFCAGPCSATSKLIWDTFSLSPFIWENSLIYQTFSTRDDRLFQTIQNKIDDRDPPLDLCNRWCVKMIQTCVSAIKPQMARWLERHTVLADKQKLMVTELLRIRAPVKASDLRRMQMSGCMSRYRQAR